MAWEFNINDRVVTPYNVNSLSINQYHESAFRIRTKMDGEIVLIDSDYSYMKTLERDYKYDKHTLTAKNNGQIRYIGEFTIFNVQFDDQQKIATFSTSPVDEYTTIHEKEDVEVNVLKGIPVQIESRLKSYLSFSCYSWPDTFGSNPVLAEYEMVYDPNDPLDTGTLTLMDGFVEYAIWWSGTPGIPTKNVIIAQERIVVDKDRTMTLWTELDDYGDAKLYGRTPVDYDLPSMRNYNTNDDIIRSTQVSIDGYYNMGPIRFPNYDEDAEEWTYEYPQTTPNYFHVKKDIYNSGQYIASLLNKHRAFDLRDVIRTLLVDSGTNFNGNVKSTLLFNDNNPDGYVLPVELEPFQGYKRYLIEKSDFKFPSYSGSYWRQYSKTSVSTIKKMLDALCSIYNSDWFIDSAGDLRIEYISSKSEKSSISIEDNPTISNRYSYNGESIPSRITFKYKEAWSEDWVDKKILYSNVPVIQGQKEATLDILFDHLTTDIDGANLWLHELNNEGFILVETENDVVIKKRGNYTQENYLQNAELSSINIISNYYRREMYQPTAKIDGTNYQIIALSLKKLKQKEDIVILNTLPDINSNIVSNLGTGDIDSISYKCNDENVYTIKSLYD